MRFRYRVKGNYAAPITYPIAFLLGKWGLSVLIPGVTWGQYWAFFGISMLIGIVLSFKLTKD